MTRNESRPFHSAASAMLVSSLVTDAHRKGWLTGPVVSIRPAADATPTAAVTGQDAT